MDEFEKKKLDKLFKTRYTMIKRMMIKFDIKINYEWMKLKKKLNQ